MPLTHSTKEIAEVAGIDSRRMQTWVAGGVLVPDEGRLTPGRGSSRQFPLTELTVAKVLASVAHTHMSVAEAASIAEYVRKIVRVPEKYDLVFEQKSGKVLVAEAKLSKADEPLVQAWRYFEAAAIGKSDPVLVLCRTDDDGWKHQFLAGSDDRNMRAQKLDTDGWVGGYVVALKNALRGKK